jgi:hypothetical protein
MSKEKEETIFTITKLKNMLSQHMPHTTPRYEEWLKQVEAEKVTSPDLISYLLNWAEFNKKHDVPLANYLLGLCGQDLFIPKPKKVKLKNE